MRICPNCGATNSEMNGNICRKCGALLPVSFQPPRMKISFEKKKEPSSLVEENNSNEQGNSQNLSLKTQPLPGELKFFTRTPKSTATAKRDALDLSPIPLKSENNINETEVFKEETSNESVPTEEWIPTPEEEVPRDKNYLKEVAPPPFEGSLIIKKGIFRPPATKIKKEEGSKLKRDLPKIAKEINNHEKPLEKSSSQKSSEDFPKILASDMKASASEETLIESVEPPSPSVKSSEDLIKDMRSLLSNLSKKLNLPEDRQKKEVRERKKVAAEKIILPQNLNEILQKLLSLDLHIEAAAIINIDGTILASAISSMISDELFITIGKNLTDISNDIINWLKAGPLEMVSIKGKQGILDVAPLEENMPELQDLILIIFSHPKAKRGVINLAISIVKKQIFEYLGISRKSSQNN
ncbi:MAG: hypothetical protein ACTSWE_04040 [Promethearchaeota archaeon]